MKQYLVEVWLVHVWLCTFLFLDSTKGLFSFASATVLSDTIEGFFSVCICLCVCLFVCLFVCVCCLLRPGAIVGVAVDLTFPLER